MRVGSYLLHLYCDQKHCEGPPYARKYCWEYGENQTLTRALRSARSQGWKLSRSGKNDKCPYCMGKMNPETEDHQ